MGNNFNRQAIVIKSLLDRAREQHEAVKYAFYLQDNSEGAKLLMKDTRDNGFFRNRYLNPDALTTRNALFGDK